MEFASAALFRCGTFARDPLVVSTMDSTAREFTGDPESPVRLSPCPSSRNRSAICIHKFDPLARRPEPVWHIACLHRLHLNLLRKSNRATGRIDTPGAQTNVARLLRVFAKSFRVFVIRIFASRLRLRRPPTWKRSCRAHSSALGQT